VTGEPLRCHPTIIVEDTLHIIVVMALFLFIFGRLDMSLVAALGVGALALTLLFSYRRWKRTLIRFSEKEVVIERDTLFKFKKVLPYSKIAAVNISQGLLNRIFGTSKLMININSGHNAILPEASLTFKRELAERLRGEMSRHLYDQSLPAEEEMRSIVSFSTKDVVVHSLFSVPTSQTLLGGVFLANSIVEMYNSVTTEMGAGGTALPSLFMFFLIQMVPSITQLFRYYNFKVHRQGEFIHLQHGLIRTYKTSFRISKINAVRVKSTLASRLLHRSCIEAEVVGIASGDSEGSSRPVICLLKDDETIKKVLGELVPEFVYERTPGKQPVGAWSVLRIRTLIASVLLVLAMAYPSAVLFRENASQEGLLNLAAYLLPLLTALAILAAVYAARVSYRVREIDLGEELFTFVNGILDRETVVMSYDKVQMVRVTKGPIARRFGVSRGTVHLLSSTGSKSISSGLFSEEQLDRIGDTVMERMASGKYDHRLNGI